MCLLPGVSVEERCQQAMDEGVCEGETERWAYDKDTHSCHKFLYSGCGGNRNNFLSDTECQLVCTGSSVVELHDCRIFY